VQGHGYRVSGRSAATAAVANAAICGVWNPHTTKRVLLEEIHLFKQGAIGAAGDALEIRRTTARGTPGSTITPSITNDENRDMAPPSGFLVDLAAYTVQPTLEANGLGRWTAAAVQGSGIVLPVNITVPPGTGLVLISIPATAWPASDVAFVIDE